MNEVTRIHLSRTAYEIDIEAKKDLEKYIAAIKQSLDDADIMDDIEARMAEILADRGVGSGAVITAGDVAAIRAQLGEPRDFAGEDADEDWRDNLFTRGKENRGGAYKKFYRDTDNGILGGVAAGLSAYTGWDLTLIRVAFVVIGFISFGWAILAYIIIWLVSPAARTASEKLEMRGEPVTLESLSNSDFGRRAKENAEAFADDVKEKVADIKSKAKQSKAEGKEKAKTVKADAKAYAAGIKADIRNEVRGQRDEQREARNELRDEIRARYDKYDEPRGPVNPVAAIFGIFLHCLGFITLVGTIAIGAVATVVLLQNSFAKEVWLWAALAALVVAGFTAVGFFMTTGQALIDRRKRRHIAGEIAGTLGASFMFTCIASVMMWAWLWTIPPDYELPEGFTHSIQRLRDNDCDVKSIKVNLHNIHIQCND